MIGFRRIRPEAILPAYQSEGAAGMDLVACTDQLQPIVIPPGEIRIIPTGWAVSIPKGLEGQVRPRSGLATKFGLTVPNAPGTIDSDYRGEVAVALINLGRQPFTVEHGMRIAQLVIAPVARAIIREASKLTPTARGEGGFGSTGV